jgi:hypothetical protein
MIFSPDYLKKNGSLFRKRSRDDFKRRLMKSLATQDRGFLTCGHETRLRGLGRKDGFLLVF